MNKATVIARRELGSYFFSPIAYVAMALFLVATGIVFMIDFRPGNVAGMRSLFEWMVWFLVFTAPVLCMGLLSQEWASGTIETLMTAPVGETDVIIGKFLGSLSFFTVLISPTLLYVIMMLIFSRPTVDLGPILAGYLGMLLVGALFISIGLFCSSVTKSQVVAAVVAAAILALITILPYSLSQYAALPKLLRGLADVLVYKRYAEFSKGVFSTGHTVFFLAWTAVFLFLSVKVLESRRWK